MLTNRSTDEIGRSRARSTAAAIKPWLMRRDADKGGATCEFPQFNAVLPANRKKPNGAARIADKLRSNVIELRQRDIQLARLSSKLIVAEQNERSKIARLLHDDLQQLLIAAKIGLSLLARKIAEVNDDSINRVQEILDGAIRTTRDLTMDLAPPVRELGLSAALRSLANRMSEQHGLVVDLKIDAAADSPREDISILLFQSARELLFNIVKHAKTDRACVKLRQCGAGGLVLTVSDKGAGFDPADASNPASTNGTGFGLPSIRERLRLLGGRIKIKSAPGAGSRFDLSFPPGMPDFGEAGNPVPPDSSGRP